MATMSIDINRTFGSMYIASCVMLTLYGITTLQAYFYYCYYERDHISVKTLVAGIWALDTLHTIFVSHGMYHYLIASFGKPESLDGVQWTLNSSIVLNVVIAFIVQAYYTRRIYRLCASRWTRWKLWIVGALAVLVLLHLVFGLGTAVQFFGLHSFDKLNHVQSVFVVLFAIATVLSDIGIAVALCFLLDNSRSEFADTNSIINRLMIYAINRCVLTATIAIAETIAFKIVPNTYYSFAIDFNVGKLYTNSLLATLNCRESLRNRWGSGTMNTQNTSTDLEVPVDLVSTTLSRSQVIHSVGTGGTLDTAEGYHSDTPEAAVTIKSEADILEAPHILHRD